MTTILSLLVGYFIKKEQEKKMLNLLTIYRKIQTLNFTLYDYYAFINTKERHKDVESFYLFLHFFLCIVIKEVNSNE